MTAESCLFDRWWMDDGGGCHCWAAADKRYRIHMCGESSRCFFFVVMLDFNCFSFTAAFMAFKPLISCNSPTPCAPTSQGLCQKSHLKSCNIIDPENLPVPDPTVCTEWGSCCWLTVRSFLRLSHCLGRSLLGENEIPLHRWRASDHRTSVHKTGCFGKLSYDGCSTLPFDTGGKMKTALWINLIWYLMNGPHLR